MRFRLVFVLAIVLGALTQPVWAQQASGGPEPAAAVPPRKVMTWVPPYGMTQSWARLSSLYSGAGPRNALTHLALQFWVPTPTGGLARSTRYRTFTNANIQTFVTWGHRNGIKVVLCVYNGEYGWDWPLAKAGFNATNRTNFINALIAEMQARGLDGIDADLEGLGDFEADKPAYVAFVRELARRVHLLGKIVTVDSFHYIYNAPNQNWWAALFPYVDGINSMGYEDLGRNAPTWQRYSSQKTRAGAYSAKLQIGIPSYLPTWQGNTTLQQTNWFRSAQAGRVGVAIWDAQLTDASWKSAPVWQVLRAIRQN